jgi:Tol biopolymer transport system component
LTKSFQKAILTGDLKRERRKKHMKKKVWELLLTLIASSLLLSKTVGAWENEWAIYKNLDLSPDETKVLFERCWFFEEKGCDDSVKGNEIYVVDITGKNLESITRPFPSFQNLSPDKSLVLCPMHGGWHLVDIKTGSRVKQIARDSHIIQFSWSPTGKEFLLTTRSDSTGKAKASLVDAKTFEETILDSDFVTVEMPFRWYSDGSTFLYLMPLPYPEIYFWDISAMRSDLLASGYPGERFEFFNISPDDQKMLYKYQDYFKIQYLHRLSNRIPGRARRKIVCREVDLPAWSYEELNKLLWSQTGEDVLKRMDYVMIQRDFGRPFFFAKIQVIWSPDGQKVLIKGKDQIWIYDLTEDKFTPIWRDTTTVISDVAFDPNHERIFMLTVEWHDRNGNGVFDWLPEGFTNLNVLDLKEGKPRILVQQTNLINFLSFSSDGNILAFEKDDNIWLLNLETLIARQLTASGGRNVQWMKDDKGILFNRGGSLYTIDIEGKNLKRLTMDKAMQPVWLNNSEIAVKSEGKYWKVNIDKLGVIEMSAPPKKTPRVKGKKYEIYINEFKSGPYPQTLTEIWAKEIETSKSWKIMEAYKNW